MSCYADEMEYLLRLVKEEKSTNIQVLKEIPGS